ncbi:MAG TPA: hypothetical protein VLV55_14870, partial [Rhizomicrobium sp.]|nr:hypothetical protein [Rhizomicrobium sp.]
MTVMNPSPPPAAAEVNPGLHVGNERSDYDVSGSRPRLLILCPDDHREMVDRFAETAFDGRGAWM